MATVGLRDLFVAPITMSDDDEEEIYGETRRLAEAIKADLSVKTAEGTIYADDRAAEVVKEFDNGTLKLNVRDLKPEDVAELLGQKITDDGVILAGGADDPPFVAIGFRAKKTGGKFRYLWLYKVKFQIPSESFQTQNGSISFNTPEIEGTIVKRKKDDLWKADYTGKEDDEIASGWFDEVYEDVGA